MAVEPHRIAGFPVLEISRMGAGGFVHHWTGQGNKDGIQQVSKARKNGEHEPRGRSCHV